MAMLVAKPELSIAATEELLEDQLDEAVTSISGPDNNPSES